MEYNIRLRKSTLTELGNLIVTGEAIVNTIPGMPVLTFNQNLDLVSNYFYTLDLNGVLFGNAIIEVANNKVIIGASGRIICINALTGAVLWSKIVESVQTPTTLDSLVNINDIKAINTTKTQFYTTFFANYFDDQTNLIYIANAKLDEFGNFSELKAIKKTPFTAIDNYQIPNAISVNLVNNSYFIAGTLYTQDRASSNDYHLNYLHKGNLNQISCGEENISQNLIVTNTTPIYLNNFPSNLIIPVTVQAISKTLTIANITPDYNNQYCIDQILSTPDVNFFNFQITPNPVQNILNIQSQEIIKEISIYDLLGKKMITTQVSTSAIDVSGLAQGVYIVKVINENDVIYSSKFIKQ